MSKKPRQRTAYYVNGFHITRNSISAVILLLGLFFIIGEVVALIAFPRSSTHGTLLVWGIILCLLGAPYAIIVPLVQRRASKQAQAKQAVEAKAANRHFQARPRRTSALGAIKVTPGQEWYSVQEVAQMLGVLPADIQATLPSIGSQIKTRPSPEDSASIQLHAASLPTMKTYLELHLLTWSRTGAYKTRLVAGQEWYSMQEVAQMLGVSLERIQEAINDINTPRAKSNSIFDSMPMSQTKPREQLVTRPAPNDGASLEVHTSALDALDRYFSMGGFGRLFS